SKRILAVDDTPDNLFLVQTLLEDDGYEVDLADSGEDALMKVETRLPDLILLDVMMPGIDGYEVVRRIRQNKSLYHIPILLITAQRESRQADDLTTEPDGFIRKPIDLDELLEKVKMLLTSHHGTEPERDTELSFG
ncbi:MAG TPA: response regulator, partial [Allocoleopsis sp.]